MIDATIAIAVLMAVLLPVSYLLISTNKITFNDQDRLTAITLANGQISHAQTQALAFTAFPKALPTTVGLLSLDTDGSGWQPASPAVPLQVTDGSVQYTVYGAAGWCSDTVTLSTSSWTNGSTAPFEYWVAIKVTWGPVGSSAPISNSVIEYGALPTRSTWTPPSGPLGTNGLCPTGMS